MLPGVIQCANCAAFTSSMLAKTFTASAASSSAAGSQRLCSRSSDQQMSPAARDTTGTIFDLNPSHA